MESSECESADDTDAEQLVTAHCTSPQKSGGGSAPAIEKADRLAADSLWRKPLKSVLRGFRATILFCITHLQARHVLSAMHMPSLLYISGVYCNLHYIALCIYIYILT